MVDSSAIKVSRRAKDTVGTTRTRRVQMDRTRRLKPTQSNQCTEVLANHTIFRRPAGLAFHRLERDRLVHKGRACCSQPTLQVLKAHDQTSTIRTFREAYRTPMVKAWVRISQQPSLGSGPQAQTKEPVKVGIPSSKHNSRVSSLTHSK